MGARISQEVFEPLIVTSPNARVTQEVLEALEEPLASTRHARVTQEFMEPLILNPRNARITQEIIEFLYIPGVFGSENKVIDDVFPMRPQVSP